MACHGLVGDYLCQGWRCRAALIRERDGGRCRGCNRGGDDVRLEVHHRVYGEPHDTCGNCLLTGVADADLITLCIDCHDGITDVRRRVRYGTQTVEVTLITDPEPVRSVTRISAKITTEIHTETTQNRTVIRRSVSEILGEV